MATQQWFGYGAPVSISGTEVTLSYDGVSTKNPTWNTIKSWININVVTEAPNDSAAYVRKSVGWARPAYTDITGTLTIGSGGTGATTAPTALTALGGAPLASPTFTGTASLASATFTGTINLAAATFTSTVNLASATSVSVPTPTTNAHAATKLYVDTNAATRITAVAGALYGWNAAGTVIAKSMNRTAAGTSVTLSADDDGYRILCTNSAATTITASDFGVGHSCAVQWVGTGQPTIVAGSGVTLVSPNTTPTYTPLARYGSLDLTVVATNTVSVEGIMGASGGGGGGGGATTYTAFSSSAGPVGAEIDIADSGALSGMQQGLMFRSTVSGSILGMKFYKASTNTGTHVGTLYDHDATVLASATFTGETASGWQTLTFTSPITVSAWHTYTVAYSTTSGHVSATANYFNAAILSGPIYTDLSAGRYEYQAGLVRPTQAFGNSNYWVDVIFSTTQTLPSSLPTRASYIGPNKDLILNGASFLPLGLYHATSVSATQSLGFNMNASYQLNYPEQSITSGETTDINTWVSGGMGPMIELSSYTRPKNYAALVPVVTSLTNKQIILNYVIDEPGYTSPQLFPQDVLTMNNLVRDADPNHATFIIDDRTNVLPWAAMADITAIDYYPVRYPDMHYDVSASDSLAVMLPTINQVITAAQGRAVWLAVQCHSIPPDGFYLNSGRFPTPAEVRMMSYQALQHGVTGLLFYDYNSNSSGFVGIEFNPTLAAAIPGITAELKTNMPKYIYGTKVVLSTGNAEIDAVSLTYLGATTTIALNPTARTLSGTILGTAVSMPPMTIRIT